MVPNAQASRSQWPRRNQKRGPKGAVSYSLQQYTHPMREPYNCTFPCQEELLPIDLSMSSL